MDGHDDRDAGRRGLADSREPSTADARSAFVNAMVQAAFGPALQLCVGEGVRRVDWKTSRTFVVDYRILAAIRALKSGHSLWSGGGARHQIHVCPPWARRVPSWGGWVCYEVFDQEYWRWFAENFATLPDDERPKVRTGARLVVAAIPSSRAVHREFRIYLLGPRRPVPSGSLDS